jgi:plasmid stabilization system protein ParE
MVAREIYTYISRHSPRERTRSSTGSIEKAHLPLTFPDVGHLYQPEKYPGVRILLYGRYRIVYQRRSDENVYVLGVFHGALDLKRHLGLTGGHEAARPLRRCSTLAIVLLVLLCSDPHRPDLERESWRSDSCARVYRRTSSSVPVDFVFVEARLPGGATQLRSRSRHP